MPAFIELTEFLDRVDQAFGTQAYATVHVEGGTELPVVVVRGEVGRLEMDDVEGVATPVAFIPIVNADQADAVPPAGLPIDTSMVAKVEVIQSPSKVGYRVWCRKSVVTLVLE